MLKKKLAIIIGIVVLCLTLAYFYFSQNRKEVEVKHLKFNTKETLQLYTFDINDTVGNGFKEYKVARSGSVIDVDLDNWIVIEGIGTYFKLINFEGKNNIYAEENITKYFTYEYLGYDRDDRLNNEEVFPLKDYYEIPTNFKTCIIEYFKENKFIKTKEWRFSTISNRAKHVVTYGDFTGSKIVDIAFLLENSNAESNKLMILHNYAYLKWHILYSETYEGSPHISNIKKNELIYMDSFKLVPSPNDGVLVVNSLDKRVILYNPVEKQFKDYHQYSIEEIKEMKKEMINNIEEENLNEN